MTVTKAAPSWNNEGNIKKFGAASGQDVLSSFGTDKSGFSSESATSLLKKYGMNLATRKEKASIFNMLASSFLNPFSMILLVIMAVSVFTDIIMAHENDYSKIIILSVIILISGATDFVQGLKSRRSMEALLSMVSNTAHVMRDGKLTEINVSEVVPGDIVKLAAGDIIPADIRIIENKDLYVSQSTLTGEAIPVEKFAGEESGDKNIFELRNICFMGTNVVSGSATAVVLSTGKNTYFGSMSRSMQSVKGPTAFDTGIKKVTKLLLTITGIIVPLVFVINLFMKGFSTANILNSLVYSIAISVGITPELLVVIVTTNLAKGAIAMSKEKTIVKDLNSIQNMGAMDVLCTDQTGTLTQNKIILERYLGVDGKEDINALKYAYLNSCMQTGLNNLLDVAIIDCADKNGLNGLLEKYKVIDEVPFDFNRRRMSVVLEEADGGKLLVTKGAVAEILSVCGSVELNGESREIDEDIRSRITETADRLSADGLRVIAIACKNEGIHGVGVFGVQDECDMRLVGYVAFLDPPKESAKRALEAIRRYGVSVKIITGDSELVARKICGEVGLDTRFMLTGKQLETMDPKEMKSKVEETSIFAKISPLQKAEVVRILKANGHTVGYMGDGINDAPALVESDVGISVDSGVEIAKESADIILLEKDLMVLHKGLIQGRRIFANIMKYLKMSTSGNVGNMISVMFASISLPFLPMLPIQILLQNLLYDLSQIAIPFDNVDEDYLLTPKVWEVSGLRRFIAWFGPVSSVFDLLVFAILWYAIGANAIPKQAVFQTGWFVFGLVSQSLVVHSLRTGKIGIIQSNASAPLIASTLAVACMAVLIPFTSLGGFSGMTALPKVYFIYMLLLVALYFVTTEIVKRLYVHIYKSWL